MPKLDFAALPQNNASGYPAPFDAPVQGRWKRRLAAVAGLAHLGATHTVLKPGAWSSQRHWHHGEDELVVILTGAATLVEDDTRTPLHPGDVAVFPAGAANGHHIVNDSDQDCSFLALSAGPDGGGVYSDIDMLFTEDGRYTHRDGTPYPERQG